MKNTNKIVTVVTYNGASADMKPILSDNIDKSGVYPLTNPADLVDGKYMRVLRPQRSRLGIPFRGGDPNLLFPPHISL
jgi:hypothetical protein